MPFLILLRHGESLWNQENRFTGSVDVSLSKKGEEEARVAGSLLKDFPIDKLYTSVLCRAVETARMVLDARSGNNIPIIRDESLNERNYGLLQGLNKSEVARQFGSEQVRLWRRSYSVRPPGGESLEDTAARTLPYFNKVILADIKAGKNVLVVAHGNSLRTIVMFLDKLSVEKVAELNIPTGVPLIYHMSQAGFVLSKKCLSLTPTQVLCL